MRVVESNNVNESALRMYTPVPTRRTIVNQQVEDEDGLLMRPPTPKKFSNESKFLF